ncbi:MAG: hypothetical protein JW794_01785 [Candidatus Cloacimonetes bacterium]|nr:hypothetical protein [Candidatus Cloacimonadota bacterium]
MDKSKKLRAAIAGVLQFLKQEEESSSVVTKKSSWSLIGRKTIMQNQMHVQRRSFQSRNVKR